MLKSRSVFGTLSIVLCVTACTASDTDFRLALVDHAGKLSWSADGYKVIQFSAKPNGNEIGVRANNGSGITFLDFLFLVPEQVPLTNEKCRDAALDAEKKNNPSLKIQSTSEISSSDKLPVSLVSYTAQGPGGKVFYMVRGFAATADLCEEGILSEYWRVNCLNPSDGNLGACSRQSSPENERMLRGREGTMIFTAK